MSLVKLIIIFDHDQILVLKYCDSNYKFDILLKYICLFWVMLYTISKAINIIIIDLSFFSVLHMIQTSLVIDTTFNIYIRLQCVALPLIYNNAQRWMIIEYS